MAVESRLIFYVVVLHITFLCPRSIILTYCVSGNDTAPYSPYKYICGFYFYSSTSHDVSWGQEPTEKTSRTGHRPLNGNLNWENNLITFYEQIGEKYFLRVKKLNWVKVGYTAYTTISPHSMLRIVTWVLRSYFWRVKNVGPFDIIDSLKFQKFWFKMCCFFLVFEENNLSYFDIFSSRLHKQSQRNKKIFNIIR